jgi:hypothetical protein
VAVRTTDFALVNLSFDSLPAATASSVDRNVGNFVGNVIELENDDVALSAVQARVFAEILDDLLPHLRTSLCDLPKQPRLLALMILPIVPGVRFREAVATPRLQLRLAAPHRGERLERFQLATFRARSHERERADISTARE